MWQEEKKKEMEERKLVQALYRDLVDTAKLHDRNEASVVMENWIHAESLLKAMFAGFVGSPCQHTSMRGESNHSVPFPSCQRATEQNDGCSDIGMIHNHELFFIRIEKRTEIQQNTKKRATEGRNMYRFYF